MRPPILFITIGFAIGIVLGEGGRGTGDVYLVAPILATALLLARRAPLGAAVGVMGVAGTMWGGAAVRERSATCAGEWGRGTGDGYTRAAIVRLVDPAPDSGGLVDADVVGGTRCGGGLRLRWPDHPAARGGTTWVVAGRWVGLGTGEEGRGVFVARRVKLLDPVRRGRGALRDRIVARAEQLFGSRAAMVEALVIARRTELDPAVRDRYAQAGLAHLLVIAGLHVGFLAGVLSAFLGLAGMQATRRAWLTAAVVLGYVWLLGFPAPAARAAVMFVLHACARWRQRVVAPRGLLGLTVLVLLVADPWALQWVGAWLSLSAVGAVIWAGRAARGLPKLAPRGSVRGRHAAHGPDHRVRVWHGGADRGACEPRRHPARRGRRTGPRALAGRVVGGAAARAVPRSGVGPGTRAARPGGPRRGGGARGARHHGRRLAGGGRMARRSRRRLVALELSAPSLAFCRADRLRLDGFPLDVPPRRRIPRRLPLLDCIFSRRGAGGRSVAANPGRTVD